MASQTFRQLDVWNRAHEWVLAIYRLTATFPCEEMFGLTSQLRRSAVSVPANIAEGFVKRSRADKARFYNIAQGSLEESRYYLILSQDLKYTDTRDALAMTDQISKMLHAYTTAILNDRR